MADIIAKLKPYDCVQTYTRCWDHSI